MHTKIIRVDFKSRTVIQPSLLERLQEAEGDEGNRLLDDLAFYNSEDNRQLIRRACVQGLGLLKQIRITSENVMPSRMREFERESLEVLCELILGSDPSMWPLRPHIYGAVTHVLVERYKRLYKINPEIKKLMEQI